MSENPEYLAQFKDLKKRELTVIAVFLGYIPAIACFAWAVSHFTKSETPIMVLAIAWMTLFAVSGLRVSFFKCPKCGGLFNRNKYWFTTRGRKCPHCGVNRYSK